MNPTPAAIAAIRSRVTDWAPSDASIAAALNAPSVANPATQPTVPATLTVPGVLGALSGPSLAKLVTVPFLAQIRSDINGHDRAACALWAQVLLAGSIITTGEASTLQALLTATQLDPSWPAQISWAQAALGRPVDAADIAEARPSS